jgi:uncharacterized membrane protein YciS (DUF1049 family)
MKIRTIILITLVIIVTIISTQNIQTITFNFIFWDISLSLIILMYIILIIGFIIGISISPLIKISRRKLPKQ